MFLQALAFFLGNLDDRAMSRCEISFGWSILHILEMGKVAFAKLVIAIGIAVVHENIFIAANQWEYA